MNSPAHAAICWLLCLAQSLPAQTPSEPIEPGKTLDRSIGAGEGHTYELQADAGQYLHLVITPRQGRLQAALSSPDGKQMVVADASTQGPEEISWIVSTSGRYRITVNTAGAKASGAAYSLHFQYLRQPGEGDRTRASAFQAFVDAENLVAKPTAESRKRAAPRYEESLAAWRALGDVSWQGRVLYHAARNLEALGQLIKARDALLAALPLRRAAGNRAGEANTLNNLGLVYNGLGEPVKALEALSQALELSKTLGNRGAEADTLNNIAIAHWRMGDNVRASEVLLNTLEVRREVGDRLGEAIALSNLGSVYLTIGDIQKALDRFQAALAYRREMGDRRGEAAGLNNVGIAYRALGEPAKTQGYWIQAAAVFEAAGDRRGLATTLTNLGTLAQGPEALRYLNRSLSIRREIGDRQGEASTLASISGAQLNMAQYLEARKSAEDGLQLARSIGFRRGEGISLAAAGKAHLRLGDRDRARDCLSQALPLFQAGGERTHESHTLAALGELELSAGNLPQALGYSRLAVATSESIRGGVNNPELRASFRAYRGNYYGLYVDVLMGLHRQAPSDGYDMVALEANERSLARSLVEMLAESQIDLRQALSADQRRLEEQILDRVTQAQRELFRSALPESRKAEVTRQLAAAERELDTFQLELGKGDSPYAAVRYGGALDRDRIRREILGRDTALIEFALGEKNSYVWVLTPEGSVSATLPPRKQIEERVEAYRKEMAQRSSALTVRTALLRLDRLGAELYRDLLGPIESALGTAHRLIIVPDGVLAYLPFETLGIGPRLIERFAISYSPSASALATLQGRSRKGARPEKTLLAFGDAVYTFPSAAAAGRPAPIRSDERGLDFTQLPRTRTEVTAIRSLFPSGSTRAYLGAEAREETVKSEPLDQYRFLHFALHGYYDEAHPGRSGIALSLNRDSNQDGLLQVREIMRLRLHAEMVTLSACQTGLGKLVAGEGVMGMSRAFLYAGADSVLTSLWKVDDASTAELMRAVYRNITSGVPRDEALRAAKLQLLRGSQTAWRHPYYWAPFVLLGDSAAVPGLPR